MLKDTIKQDLHKAQKQKDKIKISTLRMLLSAVQYFEIAKKSTSYQATDEEVLSVIEKEAKKRREAIVLYKKGKRKDLAQKEEMELEILKQYLPKQISENDLKNIVKEAIQQTGASSQSDMGKVMGVVMGKVKGKTDGNTVRILVQEHLS